MEENNNGHAVIFDMDGVICHTNPYHVKAFEVFFGKYGIAYTQQDLERHMYGKHNSYIMSHFFQRPIGGEELAALDEEKEVLFREIYRDKVEAIAGYADFLRALRAAGFQTAVATSAPRANLDLIVDALGIRDAMDSLMSCEDVSQYKPHPEVYLKTAQNMGLPPAKCLVFEDSHSGVAAALNAGMKVIGVLSSHTKEELPPCGHYIRDYTEILVENGELKIENN